jgi:hypothetical protein
LKHWKREDWFLIAMGLTSIAALGFSIVSIKSISEEQQKSETKIKEMRSHFIGLDLTKE